MEREHVFGRIDRNALKLDRDGPWAVCDNSTLARDAVGPSTPTTGIANVVASSLALGSQAGLAVLLLPSAALGAMLFRPGERWAVLVPSWAPRCWPGTASPTGRATCSTPRNTPPSPG
jgi:hypothetical protein